MRSWVLAAVLLAAPLAAAQLPSLGGGHASVAWTWTPDAFTLDAGSIADGRATATITFTGAVCGQGAVVTAQGSLGPDPGTSFIRTDPLVLNATTTVPPGAYGEPLGPDHTATVEVPFQLLVDLGAPPRDYVMRVSTSVAVPSTCAQVSAGGNAGSPGTVDAFTIKVQPTTASLAAHPPHEDHGAGGFDLFLEPGAKERFQFNATGTFTYHDHFRPELRGTVVVEESGANATDIQVSAQGFNPAEARVRVGGNVTWTNADRVGHTISADELHPQHAAAQDDGEAHAGESPEEHGMEGQAPPGAGDGNATAPSDPPRRSPGLEPLGLGAVLGLAALGLRGRPRRRA